MEILQVNDLTKKYGNGKNTVHALNHVTFSINHGEFVAITGASGSGKSTLLHILGGVDRPDCGQVIINGTNLFSLSEKKQTLYRRRNISLIYQFYNLIPVLTAEENILLPLLIDGKSPNLEKLDKIIHILGLEERRNHLPSQLSGGQQQRVSIGRSLITHPKIILADEPTGNLDQINTTEIMSLFRKLNQSYHQTIIMVTHDIKLARQCDRILTIENGQLVNI